MYHAYMYVSEKCHISKTAFTGACEDGKSRMGRIRGRIKKRKWIRSGNLLIVRPWDFQDDKADILYCYTPTQASNLARRNKIPDNINVF